MDGLKNGAAPSQSSASSPYQGEGWGEVLDDSVVLKSDILGDSGSPLEDGRGEVEIAQSPLCRELRSKKYFNLQSLPMTPDDILDAANHCWCRLTMQVVGPDGEMVHPRDCHGDRGCYKSAW